MDRDPDIFLYYIKMFLKYVDTSQKNAKSFFFNFFLDKCEVKMEKNIQKKIPKICLFRYPEKKFDQKKIQRCLMFV